MLNRTMCDVLEEMRTCTKTLNFSYLLGLIEEAQSMGNNMENKLQTNNDYNWLVREIKKLKKEKKQLKEDIGKNTNRWEDD